MLLDPSFLLRIVYLSNSVAIKLITVSNRFSISRLKELHQKCPKEMDAYAGCMYYYTNEFDFCRKEQQAFEEACPI
jgi:hypothetical protein